jgi:hypothetical protein
MATVWPDASRQSKSTGPMSVGYSRRTRRRPGAMAAQLAASSSWRWASTPSFHSPGSTPSSWLESDSTSCSVMVRVSPPLGARTTQHGVPSPSSDSVTVLGAFIQFSGLYAPPSAWTATQPSALTMISRTAGGRWAVRRPA